MSASSSSKSWSNNIRKRNLNESLNSPRSSSKPRTKTAAKRSSSCAPSSPSSRGRTNRRGRSRLRRSSCSRATKWKWLGVLWSTSNTSSLLNFKGRRKRRSKSGSILKRRRKSSPSCRKTVTSIAKSSSLKWTSYGGTAGSRLRATFSKTIRSGKTTTSGSLQKAVLRAAVHLPSRGTRCAPRASLPALLTI